MNAMTYNQFANLARMANIRPIMGGRDNTRSYGFLKSLGLEIVRETGHCNWQYSGPGPKSSIIRFSCGRIINLSIGEWPRRS